MKKILLFLLVAFSMIGSAYADIPRDDLRIELMFSSGILDTSGLNRLVTLSGTAPTIHTDILYGLQSMKFNGSGGLNANTGWSTTASTDNSTISFWIKHEGTGTFISPLNVLTGSAIIQQLSTYNKKKDIYSSNIAQNIFTSGEGNTTKFIVTKQGKCSIRGGSGLLAGPTLSGLEYPGVSNAYTIQTTQYTILESGTNIQESFDCSTLLNGKWHNVVLLSKAGFTSVLIDGVQIVKLVGNTAVGRNLNIGYSNTNVLSYSGRLDASQIPILANSKFYKGNIAAFRMYSRALNSTELEALFNEYSYSQSDLINAGNITITMEKYSKPNLFTVLKNISPELSKDIVQYEYSTNGVNYFPIANISDISDNTGSLSYRVGIDLSNNPDGKITVFYRIKMNNGALQSVGTVSYIKFDLPTAIIINMPNTNLESSKTITAEAPGATLKMFITNGSVCDSTIPTTSFEDYSDLIFASKVDNGKRLCYRASYPNISKIIYRLSDPILGIKQDSTISLFDDYTLWQKSLYPKAMDSANMLLSLLGVSATQSQGTINGITMTDINGDGLVDFLYSRSDTARRAIIVNNGNYTFKTIYKCAVDTANSISTYYGDCADITR